MNAHRNRSRTALAIAALAALSLSLTACNGGDTGAKDEGAAASSGKNAGSAAQKTGSDSGSDSGTNGGSGSGTSKTSGGTDASASGTKQNSTGRTGSTGGTGKPAAKAPECKVGYLDYTLKRENPEQQGDHLLITAENRSATACTVQKFPVVTPGAANGDVPLAKDDEQPAQPLLVQPGGTVYSAIAVVQTTKAEDDYFKSIRLSLVRNNSDDSIESVKLVTPGEVEYAGKMDDGIEVYSWNTKRPYAN